MKKYNLVFILLICISSCREVDLSSDNSDLAPWSGYEAISENAKFENDVRDITMLVYPRVGELSLFNYDPTSNPQWKTLQDNVAFQLPNNFNTNASGELKRINITSLIQIVGRVRATQWETIGPIEKKILKLEASLSKELRLNVYEHFLCWQLLDFNELKCSLTPGDDTSSEPVVYEGSCNGFKRNFKKQFVNLTDENEEVFSILFDKCKSIEKGPKKERKELKNQMKYAKDVRVDTKGVITQLLQKAKSSIGKSFIFTAGTTESPVEISCKQYVKKEDQKWVPTDFLLSLINSSDKNMYIKVRDYCLANGRSSKFDLHSEFKFGEFNRSIEKLRLYIDFDLKNKTGFHEYSIDNGKIRNISFIQEAQGHFMMSFEIITDEITVRFEKVNVTDQEKHDLRLRGDMYVTRTNGIVDKGVFSMEVSKSVD